MFKVNRTYLQVRAKLLFVFCCIFLTSCATVSSEKSWNRTVKMVSNGVVSIQSDVPVSFDGSWNSTGYGTGFIVDAEQGIILTNRHVVTPGPVTARAILINNEEIDLMPLYVDPVHDFGFYRYNPEQIKHLKPHQFTLSAKDPSIGEEIRIIGNDAGQKISILDGTISRVDRGAPNYGRGRYNDFNTFYIQAATASTGGSSGSPVININGEVVALNAGSQRKSANAFFLPLGKAKEALKKLQRGEDIQRGTIQTTFESTAYAELKRLGLTDELASEYRKLFPKLKGLLVVRSIIPESDAAKKLAVGDVLLKVNNDKVSEFSRLEEHLNNSTNKTVQLSVLRRGKLLSMALHVDNLHSITPSSLLKFDGSIFHNLSYQQARHFNKPVNGVYVAHSASAFQQAGVPNRSVITEFNGAKVETIEQLNNALKEIENGKKVHLRYFKISSPNTSNYALVEINRTWFEHSYCQQNVALGYWPCSNISEQPESQNASNMASVDFAKQSVNVNDDINNALVSVNFTSPYSVQGRNSDNSKGGTGVIVDLEKGLIVAARSAVPTMLGDVKLIFNNRLEVKGNVEYIHPLHNLAVVSFSPSALNNITVAQAKLAEKPLIQGDMIKQVGLNSDGHIEQRETKVDIQEELWLDQYNVPKFIDRNIEVSYLLNPNGAIDGVILNEQQEVAAFWFIFEESEQKGKGVSSLMAGIAADDVKQMMSFIEQNKPVQSLEVSLTQISPVDALQMGLPNSWLDKMATGEKSTEKLLAIYNVVASSPSAKVFKRGDILLAINDSPVTSFKQVEQLSQQPLLNVTLLSEGKIKTEQVETMPLNGTDIDRVLYWSGLYLHAPHRAALVQGGIENKGVYIASYQYGSPARRSGLYAMHRIVEIDGKPINDVDDLIAAVKGKPHKASVLIKTLDFSNKAKVNTLKTDNHYWPFYEMKLIDGKWQKLDHFSNSL